MDNFLFYTLSDKVNKSISIEHLLDVLDEKYPFDTAAKWDNVGLQIGNGDTIIETKDIFVALDVCLEVLKELPNNSVLITHHPLIFSPINNIITTEYVGKMLKIILQKNISYIVLHTNYDNSFLNRYFVEEILGEEVLERENSLLYYNENIILDNDYLNILKEQIEVDKITVIDSKNIIKKVAVCTGSGGSLIKEAKENGADLLITGDITYHQAIEAKELGISVIDVTHFHSERYFGNDLVEDFGFTKVEQTNPMKIF